MNTKLKKAISLTAVFLFLMFMYGYFLSTTITSNNYNPLGITIVLDAGHGNPDGGCVGLKTGITESELNLVYVNKLEKLLNTAGINIIKTRNSNNALIKSNLSSFKKQDMLKRKEIIQNSCAELVVSIHMNKFDLKSENGAQVFYYENNEQAKIFAECVRDELTKQIENARQLVLGGDYFITKCSSAPAIIVECGFLSNEQEEINLQKEDYQDKMCYAIFCGIMKYLGMEK